MPLEMCDLNSSWLKVVSNLFNHANFYLGVRDINVSQAEK